MDSQPRIEPLMRMCGIRPDRIIEVLAGDERPECQAMVRMWSKIHRLERHLLGIEGVSVCAELNPIRVWELYASASLKQTKSCVEIMLADSLPQIMRVAIKDAKKPKGIHSREHMLKAAKILPTPKGSVTNINFPGTRSDDDQQLSSEDTGLLAPADEELMKFSKAMNPPALPAPQPEILDGEPIESEENENDTGTD